MELEERSRLSYYREIESLNAEHGVELVRHSENGLFFVRKRLVNYQKEIFLQLKNDPVSNMPRIIEAVEDNGYLIVIETYLGGKTLQAVFDENGVMSAAEVCCIGRQLCDILSVLHSRGIIHRDVKPSNIILTEDGIVKLLDLDAAKVYRSDETQDTKLIGTQGYAAPEQYGFGASSPATDLYAVGVVLNVLASGQFPGAGEPRNEGLADVIRKCARLEPEERFSSAEELSAALHAVEQSVRQNEETVNSDAVKRVGRWKRVREYLLPGFRSGRILKMMFSGLWYLGTVMLAVSFLTDPPEGSTRFDSFGEAALSLAIGFGFPLLIFNYRGIWHTLRIDRIKSKFLRRVAACLCAGLLTLVFIYLFAGIGMVLISMGLIPPE